MLSTLTSRVLIRTSVPESTGRFGMGFSTCKLTRQADLIRLFPEGPDQPPEEPATRHEEDHQTGSSLADLAGLLISHLIRSEDHLRKSHLVRDLQASA